MLFRFKFQILLHKKEKLTSFLLKPVNFLGPSVEIR